LFVGMLSVIILNVVMLNVVMLSVAIVCWYVECYYTECRYAECRGAFETVLEASTITKFHFILFCFNKLERYFSPLFNNCEQRLQWSN